MQEDVQEVETEATGRWFPDDEEQPEKGGLATELLNVRGCRDSVGLRECWGVQEQWPRGMLIGGGGVFIEWRTHAGRGFKSQI